jgi:hypothetical protein
MMAGSPIGLSGLSRLVPALATLGLASTSRAEPARLFSTSATCTACHNGLVTAAGEDVSFAYSWRPTMMANAARDPYWQAAVRREILERPRVGDVIQDECSRCHMPMANVSAQMRGEKRSVFDNLPVGQARGQYGEIAADGVGCSLCHQIQPSRLGDPSSFTGGFVVDTEKRWGQRAAFGPFDVDSGRARVMRSASGLRPVRGKHVQSSEFCATCHTLITRALDSQGKVVGRLPEQVPYQEWLHSGFRQSRSCQSCHMPEVAGEVPMASVVGQSRTGVRRHNFVGGNFLLTEIFNRNALDLGVRAMPQELSNAIRRTVEHLESESARVSVTSAPVTDGKLRATVSVSNLAGHKLPTAYPSRRAWLHLVVLDGRNRVAFESGRLTPEGAIVGNDNDADARRYEPHHDVISRPEQVEIYEAIMADPRGAVTTVLLSASEFVKDNRLLPRGFAKDSADPNVAPRGGAAQDPDFVGGGDRVSYSVDVSRTQGPWRVQAELYYQPIGYRWAHNLDSVPAAEPARFTAYYRAMAPSSAVVLARAEATAVRAP